ncbi:hypothetical protein A3Q56_02933 [Intoshia linei]|uniref:Protein kinase domain-containing protein n=1 Tax=Intoshia linei TaxID=1819745 RepID=A0A177B4Q6_9BILA|nr:hypothetical protein A3Q56_02933 [Intoshia linei]
MYIRNYRTIDQIDIHGQDFSRNKLNIKRRNFIECNTLNKNYKFQKFGKMNCGSTYINSNCAYSCINSTKLGKKGDKKDKHRHNILDFSGDLCDIKQLASNGLIETIRDGILEESKMGKYSEDFGLWQNNYFDILWLELQAYRCGNSIKFQDNLICNNRENVDTVLESILKFRVTDKTCNVSGETVGRFLVTRTSSDKIFSKKENLVLYSIRNVSSFHYIVKENGIVQTKVTQQMNLLDKVFSLYQSKRHVSNNHKLMTTEGFNLKILAMTVWSNTISEMCNVIDKLGSILLNPKEKNWWPFKVNLQKMPKNPQISNSLKMYQYVAEMKMRKEGVMNLLNFVCTTIKHCVCRTRLILEKKGSLLDHECDFKSLNTLDYCRNQFETESKNLDSNSDSTRRFMWPEEFLKIGLPSLKPMYLFLVRIPVDVIHECIIVTIDQHFTPSAPKPSFPSLKQLLHEYRQLLYSAVKAKKFYIKVVCSLGFQEFLDGELSLFDNDVKRLIDIYFVQLQDWILMAQDIQTASKMKKIEETFMSEWEFMKNVCINIKDTESFAAIKFCNIVREIIDRTTETVEKEWISCKNEITNQFMAISPHVSSGKYISCFAYRMQLKKISSTSLRSIRDNTTKFQKRVMRCLNYSKVIKSDLENVCVYKLNCKKTELLEKLSKANYYTLYTKIKNVYIFISNHSSYFSTKKQILFTNITKNDALSELQNNFIKGHLVMVASDQTIKCNRTIANTPSILNFENISNIDIPISDGVVLATLGKNLAEETKEFEELLGSYIKPFVPKACYSRSIRISLTRLCESVNCLRIFSKKVLKDSEKQLKYINSLSEHFDNRVIKECTSISECKSHKSEFSECSITQNHNVIKYAIQESCNDKKETILTVFNMLFDMYNAISELYYNKLPANQSKHFIELATDWISFVSEFCIGHGLKSRYCSQGVDFLLKICEYDTIKHIPEPRFSNFTAMVYHCISLLKRKEIHSEFNNEKLHRNCVGSNKKFIENSKQNIKIKFSVVYPQQNQIIKGLISPDMNLSTKLTSDQIFNIRRNSIMLKIRDIEIQRCNYLKKNKIIGKITKVVRSSYQDISTRRVTFKWGRGRKIGQGRFGHVYSVVNFDSGDLLAMKEIKYQPIDYCIAKDIADELKLFEGISHPNLVKYHGISVYTNELCIFMEFCAYGTLAFASKQGLNMKMIRKYLYDILLGTAYLHDNSIIHRDIKGANIFLSSDEHVKMGDFGCSVKLTSTVVQNVVGTVSFMAPEMITQQCSNEKCVDIWSIGCVVIQMLTGERPWIEMDNDFMIMFHVGMGASPKIPDYVSHETAHFLKQCFIRDTKLRCTAHQLLGHGFVKI